LSYFAKPNFIAYDEWFDDNIKKNKLDVKNKEIKTISNLHEFFYEQSNYKIGASENNMQLEFKLNEKELFIKNYLENTSDKNTQLSIRKFRLFERLTKSKLKFNLTKKIIYSLSIFGLSLILGFTLFFISQSKKDESNVTNKPIELEKGF
tara:strand:- start:10 stop:459 length:450 start_codon:yes stop_codon:yes gene_type:complete